MKILSNILIALGVALLLWGATSTVEVWSKNLDPNPQYSDANMWVVLTDIV